MSEDLVLSRTYPGATKERDELPHGFAAYLTIWFELMDIITPEVLIVINSPSA